MTHAYLPPDSTAPALSLSHSQMEVFAQCPHRWWLLKRASAPKAPSEPLILGQAVHQAIEADLRQRLAGRQPADISFMNSAMDDALHQTLEQEDSTGLIPAERRQAIQQQGRAVLQTYIERIASHLRLVEVEKRFEFPHPADASIMFTGRIDAITQVTVPTPIRTIVDWKIIRRPWPIGEERRKPQATAYLWAEERMQWEPSQRVTFVTFPPSHPSGDPASPRMLDARPTSRTSADLDTYAADVLRTAERIRSMETTGAFPPQLSRLCAWCEVRGSCPAGQRYLAEQGIPAQVPALSPLGTSSGESA